MEIIEAEKKKEFLRMANYLHNLFMNNNIWYSLAFGSMLGAIRHNGFIPWDNDFDIYIKINDMKKVRTLIANHSLPETIFRTRGINHCTSSHDFLLSTKIDNCCLDIYPLIGVPRENNKRIIFSYICYFADMAFRHKHVNIMKCFPKNRIKATIVKMCTQIIPDSIIERFFQKIESKYEMSNAVYVKSVCGVFAPHDCFLREFLDHRVMHKFEDSSFMILEEYDSYLKTIYGDYMTPKMY